MPQRINVNNSFDDNARSWMQATGDFLWELAKVVILSLAIIVPVRYFLFQPFYVRGASMEPNFYDHEYLIIDEISYGIRVPFSDVFFPFGNPTRGEIIVFHYPRDPRQFFIKRVIGLPGETVVISQGVVTIYNDVYPEGTILKEPYLDHHTVIVGEVNQTLGALDYFVMGDNRTASLDSRTFGSVKRSLIVGRTILRGWPFNRITRFSPPMYNL